MFQAAKPAIAGLATVFVLASAAAALAQPKSSSDQKKSDASTNEVAAIPLLSAQSVMDLQVQNRADMNLGPVHDLLIGKKDGRVDYVTVSYGFDTPSLLKATYFAIPWSDLTLNPNGKKLVFDMYEKMYSPDGSYAMAGANNIAEYKNKYYIFYGRESEKGATGMSGTVGEAGFEASKNSALAEMVDRTNGFSHLRGSEVYNLKGQKLGVLEDALIHAVNGSVFFGVISVPNSAKEAVVPWPALEYNAEKGGFTLKTNMETLKQKAFEPDQKTAVTDPAKAEQVYKDYGAKPNWKPEAKSGSMSKN